MASRAATAAATCCIGVRPVDCPEKPENSARALQNADRLALVPYTSFQTKGRHGWENGCCVASPRSSVVRARAGMARAERVARTADRRARRTRAAARRPAVAPGPAAEALRRARRPAAVP